MGEGRRLKYRLDDFRLADFDKNYGNLGSIIARCDWA